MLSKLRPLWQSCSRRLLVRRVPLAVVPVRLQSGLIPPSQYDRPRSKRMQLMYVLSVHWETVPLFITVVFALVLVVLYIAWCFIEKVDMVFSPYSRNNISRTMDLRNPTVHKFMTINQRYAPWPEMQDVLDKMKTAEKRVLSRAQTCSFVKSSS